MPLHAGKILLQLAWDLVTSSPLMLSQTVRLLVFLGTLIGCPLSPSHLMGHHLYLEVMIILSSSGICRLVGLSKPSKAIVVGFVLSPSHPISPQLHQGLMTRQFTCGTFRQGSIIVWYSKRAVCTLFASSLGPPTPHLYLVTKSGSGILIVTKLHLNVMVHMLLSPLMRPSLFCAIGELFMFKALSPEQLWLNSTWKTLTHHCCFSPDGRLVVILTGHTTYVWDIINSKPCLIETLIGHTNSITLYFPSLPPLFQHPETDQ